MSATTTTLPIAGNAGPQPIVRNEVGLDPVVSQGPALLAGIATGIEEE